jgi:hypothetical protein
MGFMGMAAFGFPQTWNFPEKNETQQPKEKHKIGHGSIHLSIQFKRYVMMRSFILSFFTGISYGFHGETVRW